MNVAFKTHSIFSVEFSCLVCCLLNFDRKQPFPLRMCSSNRSQFICNDCDVIGIRSITSIANRNCHFFCVFCFFFIFVFVCKLFLPVAEHRECSAAAYNNKHFICNFTTPIQRMELCMCADVYLSVTASTQQYVLATHMRC